MLRVALIGGGISSIGALSALHAAARRSGGRRMVVHRYAAPLSGAMIRSAFADYRMPGSGDDGYMRRWGALICLVPVAAESFEALTELLCPHHVREALRSRVDGDADGKGAPYYRASRADVEARVSRLVASLQMSGLLVDVQQRVDQAENVAAGWRLRLSSGARSDCTYDALILSGGALATPRLLAASGLLGAGALPLKDHVMVLGAPERDDAYTLQLDGKALQFVCSQHSAVGFSHDVLLRAPIGFSAKDMAAIYCTVAGRPPAELLQSGLWRLTGQLVTALGRSPWPFGAKRWVRVLVGDEAHCAASLDVQSDDLVIQWASKSAAHAVSAFHFHGSLEGHPELSHWRAQCLYIGDLSATASLRDFNSGSFSFQSGYAAMRSALQDADDELVRS